MKVTCYINVFKEPFHFQWLPVQSALTPPVIPSFDQAYHITELEYIIMFENFREISVGGENVPEVQFHILSWPEMQRYT